MRHYETDTRLLGTVYGPTWQGYEGSKPVDLPCSKVAFGHGQHADPAALSFAQAACSDGDFQQCQLTADSRFAVTQRTTVTDADGLIVTVIERTRYVSVTRLPSMAAWIGDRESSDFDA